VLALNKQQTIVTLFMLSEVILYFCFWCFVVKFFKPNSHFTFTMDPHVHVLSVPINHKYWDCTVFIHVYVHVCTFTCMNTHTHTHSGLGVRQWTVIYRLQRIMCNPICWLYLQD